MCDKSKDRTRELIKKWKTGDGGGESQESDVQRKGKEEENGTPRSEKTWSVHVWCE